MAFKKHENYQVKNMIDGDSEDPRLCKNQTNLKTGKNEKNAPKRRNLLIHETSINTVAEELVSSENIAR